VIPRIPWLERRFDFDFAAGFWPEVLERLRGTPARLEHHVKGLSRDVLTRRLDEKWSIQENVGHLLDVEALWIGRLDDFEAGLATLRAADMSNRVTHEAGHNQRELADLLAAFRSTREGFVARLDALDSDAFARTAQHPRLGVPMRLVDALTFTAHHDDFHLATITLLKRRLATLETG
jgi:uncharacterized damage-inducible protein DinB